MSNLRTYNATGFVLHRTSLGEADRIVTIFTKEHGKLNAVAKGSRRANSKLTGATEPFTNAKYMFGRGRSLDVISQTEILQSYPAIRTDLDLLARASYICELLDRTTVAHDMTASEAIYELTSAAFLLLQRAGPYPDGVVHAYELHLMSELGYAPALDRCSICEESIPIRSTSFSVAQGGAVCKDCRLRVRDSFVVSAESIQTLVELRDSDTQTMLTINPSVRVSAEIARTVRAYIAHRVDRQLKSLHFLEELRQTSRPD